MTALMSNIRIIINERNYYESEDRLTILQKATVTDSLKSKKFEKFCEKNE